ncbi:stabilizer of axonemal microtubules 3 [Paramisgurnus dabryanus]|uniref:stabilizer of axonemal microtubules 3 n=1 Tax=Paramisgurnus dabryanus TaxID=90735 RepID=UPI0031F38A7D
MSEQERKLGRTSTNIGHVYTPPLPFNFNTCKNAPLPPVLRRQNEVPVSAQFTLTSHSAHDRKPLTGPLHNEIYSKAPPHWTTHFLNELAHRLRDHVTVRVVSKPISEMQDSYRGQPAPCESLNGHYSMIQALYRQLNKTQSLVQEPICSTTKTDFKHFNRSNLTPCSVMDEATFIGSLTKSGAHSRLPAHKAPSTLSCQPRLPCPHLPLPYRGKSSVYVDSFKAPVPAPLPTRNIAHRVVKQQERGSRDPLQDILSVPKMYSTENQIYGKNKMSVV